ncbi:uncharacterized protein TRIREDRAFT_103801 [Trichoderma reesei QM6a]|uniref:Predicted protein n=2 Tax=Hypocrea jecorina TaxID=51453 RepID=G0R9V4_HYPJQ|nr:uncharacterized protein TRIREDRAFT_103801 [Trichoderma reesei QM6a]EGR52024.1 predicted protein [Trichoderma reesei QM6a]ETS05326.1 hypothetical protein M419DRAFT_71384 [Trichoderma reesei RUT C-30]
MLPTRHRGEYTETVDATLTHKRGHPRIIVPSGEHIVDSRSGAESEPGENCHYRLTLNVPPGICLICRGTEQRWRLYDGHLSRKSSLTALDQDQHPAQERLPQTFADIIKHCFPCVLLGDTPLQEAAIILTPHRRSSNGLDTTLLITRCWQSTYRQISAPSVGLYANRDFPICLTSLLRLALMPKLHVNESWYRLEWQAKGSAHNHGLWPLLDGRRS